VLSDRGEYWVAEKIQSLTKWIFDLFRNAIVAGVLNYLADKSGSLSLKIAAAVASGALLAYCITYLNIFALRLFHPLKNQRFAFFLNAAFGVAIIVPLSLMITYTILAAIDAIAQSQGDSDLRPWQMRGIRHAKAPADRADGRGCGPLQR
jgi:hypothetical protein